MGVGRALQVCLSHSPFARSGPALIPKGRKVGREGTRCLARQSSVSNRRTQRGLPPSMLRPRSERLFNKGGTPPIPTRCQSFALARFRGFVESARSSRGFSGHKAFCNKTMRRFIHSPNCRSGFVDKIPQSEMRDLWNESSRCLLAAAISPLDALGKRIRGGYSGREARIAILKTAHSEATSTTSRF